MISNPRHKNRLASEKSPYLLQHAHNPVDWFPWGLEAFKKAQDEDKPIFLSIGYATCHWCHVMERESFENPEVAALMNQAFVNIKLDREEMPEVDSLYMEFAQSMMSGAGGWPLNVILTPDLEPFFASTYLPPVDNHGMMGLSSLIEKISEVWNSDERTRILAQAERLVQIFTENVHMEGEDLPAKEQIENLAQILFKLSDPVWGGLKGSPKFPIGYQTVFLLRYYVAAQDSRALFLAERSLDMMQRGGIYDHIGGGFSRYSVDEEWLQPHFEKMLYDNALLMDAYLEAYKATKKPIYRQVVEEIASYILTDMTSMEGGFFAAEDADSEGEEGLFYTWTKQEVMDILGKTEGAVFCEYYDISKEGNFDGTNILHTSLRIPEFSEKQGLDPLLVEELIREGKNKLYQARIKRERPFLDDKILTGWNGLMVHSLAQAGDTLSEPSYIQAAVDAATFIKQNLWKNGQLLRRYRDKDARFSANLEDYAFLIRGLITLFEVGAGTEWLEWALKLNENLTLYYKSEEGAYFQSDNADPYLLIRKSLYSDGAEPSGNAVQCENLLRFAGLLMDDSFRDAAEDVLKATKKFVDNYPPGYVYHLMNLNKFFNKDAPTLVVALNAAGDGEQSIRNLLKQIYNPLKTVFFKKENDTMTSQIFPHLEPYKAVHGKTTLYLCRRGFCEQPLTEEADIQEAILKLAQTV